MSKHISQLIIDKIIHEYVENPKMSCSDLALKYNISGPTVSKYIKLAGHDPMSRKIKNSKRYTINESYFDNIDSENKAYFLGFLFADGHNSLKRKSITLALMEDDVDILKFFQKELNSNRPLFYQKKENPNHKNMVHLIINSVRISNKLKEYGMGNTKTHTLKFPEIITKNNNLIKHFIRGFFDGDGSFSIYSIVDKKGYTGKRYECSIISTIDFLKNLETHIMENVSITKCHYRQRHKDRDNNIRALKISGKQMFHFLHWIYNGSNISLSRKYKKYIDAMEEIPEFPRLNKVNAYV